MQKKTKLNLCLLAILLLAIAFLFPFLFRQTIFWQREFNQQLSHYLHQIAEAPSYAGTGLILLSFAYGILHALGPGHGKFIIASYLSTHESKLLSSMRLTFLSSLMQGLVAISATSILLLGLQLSSKYFKLSQLWLERGAYVLILLLGLQWLWQARKSYFQKGNIGKPLKFNRFQPVAERQKPAQSAVVFPKVFLNHAHAENCGCGHQHLPSAKQLEQQSWKSQFMVILSIGMRPCSGAIFILFLAYMLDLYIWGVVATMAMAIGTGLCLSSFALLVLYARKTALRLGGWYFSQHKKEKLQGYFKIATALVLIFFALSLLYGTTIPASGGAILFQR